MSSENVVRRANAIARDVLSALDHVLSDQSIFTSQMALIAVSKGLQQRVNATNQKYLELIDDNEASIETT